MIEPGPRSGRPGLYQSRLEALLYLAIAICLSGIVVTAALLVYLIASGRV